MTAVSVLSAGSKVSQCEGMFLSSSISSLAKLSAYLTDWKSSESYSCFTGAAGIWLRLASLYIHSCHRGPSQASVREL